MNVVSVERKKTLRIVERDGDFRRSERLTRRRSVENNVRHFVSAKTFGALFAQSPLNRVDDVRFTRAVGPDERADAAVKIDLRAIGKAFKAAQFD